LSEDFPVDKTLQVVQGETISKSQRWWIAVLKLKSQFKSSPQVALYMWRHDGKSWKRKQKFTIVFGNWVKIKQAVDKMFQL